MMSGGGGDGAKTWTSCMQKQNSWVSSEFRHFDALEALASTFGMLEQARVGSAVKLVFSRHSLCYWYTKRWTIQTISIKEVSSGLLLSKRGTLVPGATKKCEVKSKAKSLKYRRLIGREIWGLGSTEYAKYGCFFRLFMKGKSAPIRWGFCPAEPMVEDGGVQQSMLASIQRMEKAFG